jgi:hypothetical protein
MRCPAGAHHTPRTHCWNQPQQLCFPPAVISIRLRAGLQPSCSLRSNKTGVHSHGLLIFLHTIFYHTGSKLRFVPTPTTVRRRKPIPPSTGVYPIGATRGPALHRRDDVAHHRDIAAQRQQHRKHVPVRNVRHRRAVDEAITLINPGSTRIFPPVTRKQLLTWPA